MLRIYPDIVDAVEVYVNKRWPEKQVTCQDNESAWHRNRFIKITTKVDSSILHYEYIDGYLELHLEGDYYDSPFNQMLYQHLRRHIDTSDGDLRWHRWYGKTQGLLRYEYPIDNAMELADALSVMISYIDPIVDDFLNDYESENCIEEEDTNEEDTTEYLSIETNTDINPSTGINNASEESVVLETMEMRDILSLNLRIPTYQRIYCWPQKNVEQLLDDILIVRSHKYHLGTIILQKKGDDYDIIDGQQRLVTLALILRALHVNNIKLLNESFDSVEAQNYIAYNRYVIESYLDRFFPSNERRTKCAENILAMTSLDVLILQDSSLDLAYTFFSTQNARGKALTDYELLKSHHLRFIPESFESQQRHLAQMWDHLLIKSERDNGDRSVSTILGIYLYCLRKWTCNQYWYIKEDNRVKNEFEAAPTIPEIPPFGERFDFMDPIQGGTHFFAYVDNFIQHYNQFTQTIQYSILWNTISCSGKTKTTINGEETLVEKKKRTHWWYGDVIATFLFAYYLKFGNQYLSEALTCITRIVSQLRYEKSKANKQSLMDNAGELGIIQIINQATSPTFFLAASRDIIKHLPFFDNSLTGIRVDFFNCEMALYNENKQYYHVDFNFLHNYGKH